MFCGRHSAFIDIQIRSDTDHKTLLLINVVLELCIFVLFSMPRYLMHVLMSVNWQKVYSKDIIPIWFSSILRYNTYVAIT